MATHSGSPLLLVISAPSGGGKTTLCQRLLAANPGLMRALTCTTRPPRPGERDGADYYFLEEARFQQRVQTGEFLEHATVYGFNYGTLQEEVLGRLRRGNDVLLAVDVQGVASIRARAQEEPELQRSLVTLFLTPPSLSVLEDRLRKRGTDTESARQKRLSMARLELVQWQHFDYLVLSTTVEEDLRRAQVILEAEKMRSLRAQPPVF